MPKDTKKLENKKVLIVSGTSGIGYAPAEAALESGAHVIVTSSKVPASSSAYHEAHHPFLSHLIIFNQTIPKADAESLGTDPVFTGSDPDDHGELSQILFHWSRDGSRREDALKQMGLAKGMLGLLNMIQGEGKRDEAYRSVHSVDRMTLLWQPEEGFVVLAILSTKSPSPKETTPSAPKATQPTLSMSSPQIEATLRSDLRVAYERYRLLNGTWTDLLVRLGPIGLRDAGRTYWTGWASEHVVQPRGYGDSYAALSQQDRVLQQSPEWEALDGKTTANVSLVQLGGDGWASSQVSSISPVSLPPLLHYLQDSLEAAVPSKRRKSPLVEPGNRQSSSGKSELWGKSLGFDMWPWSTSGSSRPAPASPTAKSHHRTETKGDRSDSPSRWQMPGVAPGFGSMGGLFRFGTQSRRTRQTPELRDIPSSEDQAVKADHASTEAASRVKDVPCPAVQEDEGLHAALSEAQTGALPDSPIGVKPPDPSPISVLVWLHPFEHPSMLSYVIQSETLVAVVENMDASESAESGWTKDSLSGMPWEALSRLAHPADPTGGTKEVSNVPQAGLAPSSTFSSTVARAPARSPPSENRETGSNGLRFWHDRVRERTPDVSEILARTVDNAWIVMAMDEKGTVVHGGLNKADASLVDAGQEVRRLQSEASRANS